MMSEPVAMSPVVHVSSSQCLSYNSAQAWKQLYLLLPPHPSGPEAPWEHTLVGELTNLEMLEPYWKRGPELRNTGTILCRVSKGLADRLMRWGNNGANRGARRRRRGGSQHGMATRVWSQSGTPRGPAGQSRHRSTLFDSGSRSRQRAARSGQGCFP